jgi:type IV secretory pathway VirB3-like protein
MNFAMKAVGGAIIAVIGVALAKMIFGVVGAMFVFLIAVLFKIAFIALIVWIAMKLVRYFRDRPAYTE